MYLRLNCYARQRTLHASSQPIDIMPLYHCISFSYIGANIIYHFNRFDGCIALELGGGVGLCSIVMARVAKKVFCTGKLSFKDLFFVPK